MPRWRAEVLAELEAHRAIRLQPVHLLPQLAGLQQDLGGALAHEPRLYAWAHAYLAEAMQAVSGQTAYYKTARNAATGQEQLTPPTRAAQECLRARWQTATVAEAITIAVWVVRAYLRIYIARHGIVPNPHAAGFAARRG
jgi:hypothetical protein